MLIKAIYIYFLMIYTSSSQNVRNKDIVIINSGVKEVSPRSVGLQFFSVLNNTSNQDYFVELSTDQCCIDSGESLDCDSIEIIGECSQVLQKGNVKAFTMVAPVLDPLLRKGYCVIHMDSRPVDKRNKILRDVIKIDFDTGVAFKANNANFEKLIKNCKDTDLDPFNDCKPVNCDTYYNGKKPLFDKLKKRCSEAPKCDNGDAEIFDPISNRCIDSESVDKNDIDYIRKKVKRERQAKDVIIVATNTFYDNATDNVALANAQICDDVKKTRHTNILRYILTNKYTMILMAVVIFMQCFFMCSMVYCLAQKSYYKDEKPVERKYFNYRQDVSVTTPLIATSNIDTETTLDYVSESKVDNKIRCYKACQKKRENDTKMSMSDDILSKCLTRRDWNSKPKSDTNVPNEDPRPIKDWKKVDSVKKQVSERVQTDEIHNDDKKPSFVESYSERLIQCHDYNMRHPKRHIFSQKESISTEKEAQACFSNDSVDDFLSERGLIFLAGDSLSKKSFASSSTTNSEMGRSSKTSKNNVVRNTISYLFRRSKVLTSSDPVIAKSSEKSLELIHMSKASVLSSSSGYKHIKGAKCPKESRSSLF